MHEYGMPFLLFGSFVYYLQLYIKGLLNEQYIKMLILCNIFYSFHCISIVKFPLNSHKFPFIPIFAIFNTIVNVHYKKFESYLLIVCC